MLLFHNSIKTDGVSHEYEEAHIYEDEAEKSVVTRDLHSICAGDEHCDSGLDATVVNGATAIPFGHGRVHLFLTAEVSGST